MKRLILFIITIIPLSLFAKEKFTLFRINSHDVELDSVNGPCKMSYDIIVDGIPAGRLNLKSPHATIEWTQVVSDAWTMFLIEPQPGMDSILLEIYDGTTFIDSAYRYVRKQLPIPEIYFNRRRPWPRYPLRWISAEYPENQHTSCGFSIKSFIADLTINGELVYTMYSENEFFDNEINQKMCTVRPKDDVHLKLRSVIVRDKFGKIYEIPEIDNRIYANLPLH